MNIVVCIKQVPDSTEVKINPETNTLMREGIQSIINPFDMYAIEEALRIKERINGQVVVITMGPPQAQDALRETIAVGADRAILLSDRQFAGADTLATSYTLAMAIKKLGDTVLILTGKQSMDGDTAQVGPGIAVHLNIPQITFVKKIEDIRSDYIRAERMVEDGYEIIEGPLPAVISVVKEINEPRIASLKGRMRAKKTEIEIWNREAIGISDAVVGLKGSPTVVKKIFVPPQRQGGRTFHTVEEGVSAVVAFLKETHVV